MPYLLIKNLFKRSLNKKVLLVFLLSQLAACTHSIHISQISGIDQVVPAKQVASQIVEAESEQFVVLGFAFDTDYVDQAYQEIQAACGGQLTAVNTRYSTSHGPFSWTNKIAVRAVCLP